MKDNIIQHNRRFNLQWHITHRCKGTCWHCYNDISVTGCLDCDLITARKIVDDFVDLLSRFDMDGKIHVTGGDPFLHPHLASILEYIASNNIEISIMGNVTEVNNQNVQMLHDFGINEYQVSIDGMQSTHDAIRGKGNFEMTMQAIEKLKAQNIIPAVMFTLHRLNQHEIIKVIGLCNNNGIKSFNFSRMIPLGKGKKLSQAMISPLRYKDILTNIVDLTEENREYCNLIGKKDPLFIPILAEKKLIQINPENRKICSGCYLGINGLTILPKGEVVPCRRLPLIIGNVNTTTLYNIFLNSKTLNTIRNIKKIVPCKKCIYLYYCRGCRAMAYAVHGDVFGIDPQCWLQRGI